MRWPLWEHLPIGLTRMHWTHGDGSLLELISKWLFLLALGCLLLMLVYLMFALHE
jgi:hypothetical protein